MAVACIGRHTLRRVCERLAVNSRPHETRCPCLYSVKRSLHQSSSTCSRDVTSLETQKQLMVKSAGLFDELAAKRKLDKLTFNTAVQMYIAKESLYRRGHVEFIYASLQNMERFGVHRDLSVYKALLAIFPQDGKVAARTVWQVEWMHFPKQQQCAIDIMDQMEDNGVIPDHDFGRRLEKIFGTEAHAFRKYRRMMYWMPKFKHANPYPVPKELPDDGLQLALLALRRMSVDRHSKITVWQGPDINSEGSEDAFIASAQSLTQKELISRHDRSTPVFVEGGFTCWLRHKSMQYFVLRADPDHAAIQAWRETENKINSDQNLFEWKLFWESEDATSMVPRRSVHEQDDGTVLAMTVTSSATKDSLVTWIRCLQQHNPVLEQIPVVFRLRTPESQVQVMDSKPADSGVQVANKH